jgi:hypothetical protein
MESIESLGVTTVAEKEDVTCIVCMECIPASDLCRRACGHMLCITCDTSWRARGKIQEVKMKQIDSPGMCSVFVTGSGCPYCRRMDDPSDYKSRSKDSLFREIQFLTQTLFLYRINAPLLCTQPIALDAFEPVAVPVTAPNTAPLEAPVPRQLMLVPATVTASTGRCSRRQYGCTTARTKLRCNSCNQLLCRSCRGLCRHAL